MLGMQLTFQRATYSFFSYMQLGEKMLYVATIQGNYLYCHRASIEVPSLIFKNTLLLRVFVEAVGKLPSRLYFFVYTNQQISRGGYLATSTNRISRASLELETLVEIDL